MNYTIQAKESGSYDVIVCGGGTAGTIAAIAAGRQGARTLLIERTFTVGGMLTLGEAGITKFTEHCRDVDVYKKEVLDVLGTEASKSVQVAGGIAHEYVLRMIREGKALGTNGEAGSYVFTDRCASQWTLMDMLDEAGVEVMYDTRVALACKDGETVTGVVALNKEGFLEIHARCVIDATGDADVAAAAGVPFHKGVSEYDLQEGCGHHVGEQQGMGTMYRVAGVDYQRLFDYLEANPDRFWQHEFGVMSLENCRESYDNGEMCVLRVLVDIPGREKPAPMQIYNLPDQNEAILLGWGCGYVGDGLDAREISRGQEACQRGARKLTRIIKESVPGFENVRAIYVPDVGIRETRHIVGEYVLTGLEALSGKDFEDSIGGGGHPVDIHPIPPEIEHMDMNHWRFHMPYRIMLPRNAENLLVAGRCVSATRMATGCIRPTVQCMELGEAAGVAAALAVKGNTTPRRIDVQELRGILVENGGIL